MKYKTLPQIVAEKPFSDFANWWPMGSEFVGFMSEAIVSEWSALHGNTGDLATVRQYTAKYLKIVFGRTMRAGLVDAFASQSFTQPLQSGEFDALSYAFYRSAFERLALQIETYQHPVERERRLFTKRVGKAFFSQLHHHLDLNLPTALEHDHEFTHLKTGLEAVGDFLKTQGYLRDHFNFPFEVDVEYQGRRIKQREADFLTNLQTNGLAYALYEMGYPVILPSAVYLYHTLGEAQHHSSRTIEELFDLVGYEARETDDFDPTDYPSDMVVELWEIRKLK